MDIVATPARQTVPVGQRSRKQIEPFRLHRPSTIAEACALRALHGDDAAFFAGGVDLVNDMKQGFRPAEVIDLNGLAELSIVGVGRGTIELGALVTHRTLIAAGQQSASPLLMSLARLWRQIANPRIRHKGTLGGNIMARKPGYDLLTCLAALDACFVLADAAGDEFRVPARHGFPPAEALLLRIELSTDWFALHCDRDHKPLLSLAIGLMGRPDRVQRLSIALGSATSPAWNGAVTMNVPMPVATLAAEADQLAERLLDATFESRGEALSGYALALARITARRLIQLAGESS